MRLNHSPIATFVLSLSLLLGCSDPPDDLVPTRQAWVVMGTTLEISVYRPETEKAVGLQDLEAAYAEVVEIDQLMSLYREDSDVSRLNARAGEGLLPVSAPTAEVLRASVHYAKLSGSALDVTVQPLIDLWGFYNVSAAKIPSQDEIDTVLQRVGINRVTLDEVSGQVALASNTGLDFGGIAKGYAVDRAIKVLKARGVRAGLVNLGGNVGVFGQASIGRPWLIGIRHPRENRLIGQVSLMSGAVATSGDYDRYFEFEGKRYSHILDPRVGWPVEDIYSLTVVAPNATTADALSTAAFVMGDVQGMDLLSRCESVDGLLIQPDVKASVLGAVRTDSGANQINGENPSFEIDATVTPRNLARASLSGATPIEDCVWSF